VTEDLRTFADVREGLTDESRRDSKPFRHECVEDRLERGQDVRLSRLHEHSERSAHSQAALLRDFPAHTFVDEQQIRVKRLRNEDGGRFSGSRPRSRGGDGSSTTRIQDACRSTSMPGADGRRSTASCQTARGTTTSSKSAART
jgi:hypothetical protein